MLIALLLAVTLDEPTASTAAPAVDASPVAVSAPVQQGPNPFAPGVLRIPEDDRTAKALRFVWRDHPSLRAGRNMRLDFSAKVQQDYRSPGDDPVDFPEWQLHRLRAGVDGELFRVIQFSIEREFSERETEEEAGRLQRSQWKDVYVEANFHRTFQVRVGKFKVPYGLDQVSGESNLDFINRSGGGDYISPGRDIGVMAHGRFFGRRLNYSFGGFEKDGDNSRSRRVVGGDRTYAARVTVQPFKNDSAYGEAEIGGSFATTEVSDESLLPNGLRGRTVISEYTFFDPVFVKGTRRRYGVDLDWARGPFGARAEYMLVTDQRIDQGLGDQDLPDARGRAYYVLGTWVLTGEKKVRPVEARRGGVGRGGFGAVELAVRFDRLWFDSDKGVDPPFRNSRAETIYPNGDKVLTLGVNYYVNRFMKIQMSGIREHVEDAVRSPTLSDKPFWSSILRFQFQI